MRLVFITRKIDRNDTRTGFVFDWIEALASKLDRLYVICQELGDSSGLPGNVEVHSFGKEKGYGRLRQFINFQFSIFKLSRKTSGIFCHMHPIYVILAWLPAKLFRKKLVLWYTHKSVDLKLRLANMLVDSVLTASKESFRLQSNKVKIVGHGIPVEKFQITNNKLQINDQIPNSKFQILSIGRISRVKDYETLIKATEILVNDNGLKDIEVNIYGDPATKEDLSYQQSLREFVNKTGLQGQVIFHGGVSYEEIPKLFSQADLFVNLSATGSLDKAVLEAAASGILTLSSNEAYIAPLSRISPHLIFERNNPKSLAEKLLRIKSLSETEKDQIADKLYAWVRDEHNLDNLAKKIINEFASA